MPIKGQRYTYIHLDSPHGQYIHTHTYMAAGWTK
jgi:hypothetical protein